MKDKWAIIDDIRELNCDFIAKTGWDGIAMMREHIVEIKTLCMDHDLGDANAMNGFDVLYRLSLENLIPDHVQMVTSNPVGRMNMANFLLGKGFETRDGLNFYRKDE